MDIPVDVPPSPRGVHEDAVLVYAAMFQFGAEQQIFYPSVSSRMLLWCEAGVGDVRVNGEWFTVVPGDWLFLPWRHEVLYVAGEEDPFLVGGLHLVGRHWRDHAVEAAVAHSASDPLSHVPWREDLPEAGAAVVVRGRFAPAGRLRLLASYAVERYKDEAPDELAMRALGVLVFEEIIHQRRSDQADVPLSLRRMQAFVGDHLQDHLTVSAIARAGACSTASAHRLFRLHLGIGPYGYVVRTRVQIARQMLRSSGRPVAEVAAAVGIPDPYHFSRVFKRVTGASPQRFRRSVQPI